MDGAQPGRGPHIDAIILNRQIGAFHQRHAHLAGEEDMLEIGGIVDAGGEQHDLRIVHALGRDFR